MQPEPPQPPRSSSPGRGSDARRVTAFLAVLWLAYLGVVAWACWTVLQSLYRAPIPRWTWVAPVSVGTVALLPSLVALWRNEVLRGAVVPFTAAALTVTVLIALSGFAWPGWGVLGFILLGALYLASMRRKR